MPGGSPAAAHITSLDGISKSGYYMTGSVWEGAYWADVFAIMQTDNTGIVIGIDQSNPNKIYTAVKSSEGAWVKGSIGQ